MASNGVRNNWILRDDRNGLLIPQYITEDDPKTLSA